MSARRHLEWADPVAALAVTDEPHVWQDQALCAEADPDAWFQKYGVGTRDAKRVCARCPVRAECLAFALDNMTGIYAAGQYGIWGGTTPFERRQMLRGAA